MKKHLLTAAATASILFASFGGNAFADGNTYTVQSGDTLWKISQVSHVSVTNLKLWNKLTSDAIYVNQKLSLSAPAATQAVYVSPTVTKAQMIMDEAKKYIGVPYLYGGTTPAGFDCSGFVQYIYAKVGISIPRTTSTQWSGMKYISSAIPGSLVFFNTSGTGVSHVGIYLGNSQFIHAGSSGIMISDMSTSYWKPKYLGARAAY